MTSVRTIKKYENRRLYDTSDSRYINLEEVSELVRAGEELRVIDTKTGEDITRHVLTQIIVEQSRDGRGGPPVEFLRDLIRSGERSQREFLEWYLGTASEVYQKMRDTWRGRNERNADFQREVWARMWDPLGAVRTLMNVRKRPAGEQEAATSEQVAGSTSATAAQRKEPSAEDLSELSELRRRLEELEQRLAQ